MSTSGASTRCSSLGGIIVDRTYARMVLEPIVRSFKREWFQRDDIILHTADIARARRGFERLRQEADFREDFLSALSALLKVLEYQVIACVIHKEKHVARYGASAADPYDFSLEVVVERFCIEIGDIVDGGLIYAEKRREELDHKLDLAWERLRTHGASSPIHQSPEQIDERIIGLSLKSKGVNLAGLQLADLVISPVGRHILGLSAHDNWDIVRSKMCQRDGKVEGHGLVQLPE